MRKRTVGASLLALGAVALGPVAGAGTAAGPGTFTIGGMWPLTGALAPFGGPARTAAGLGVTQLNAAAKSAHIDLSLSIADGDTHTDPRGAEVLATKLADSTGVKCIAGPMASAEVIATAQDVTVDAGIPLITPSATAVAVGRAVPQRNLLFRLAPGDDLQARVLALRMRRAFGTGPVAVAGQDDAYGRGLIAAFTSRWSALGGRISSTTRFAVGGADDDAAAASIVRGRPRGFAVFSYPGDYAALSAALLRTDRWSPARTFGTDGLRDQTLPALAGRRATEGLRGTAPATPRGPLAARFQRLWTADHLGPRQIYDAQSFDAAVLCGLAAVRADSTDPARIGAAIRAVASPPGQALTFLQLPAALRTLAAGRDIDYRGASGDVDLAATNGPAAGRFTTWRFTGGRLVDRPAVYTVR